ncbi:hypothetical protein BH11ACT2_BH11ACT2_08850 [soil metagenome]
MNHRIVRGPNRSTELPIIAMIRVRNEQDLMKDTLDHLATFADGIIVFDDASTDDTLSISLAHPLVIEVIVNRQWRSTDRIWEETANRRILNQRALKRKPQWLFYSDADERFEGDIRDYLLNECAPTVGGIRIRLLDAYITSEDQAAFVRGQELWNFRSLFGVERRDILMAWRSSSGADFVTPDAREPRMLRGEMISNFWCQHYGKSMSIAQWDETCRYYVDNFPIYRDKWAARIGKAVHVESDFGTPLYKWDDVKSESIQIN